MHILYMWQILSLEQVFHSVEVDDGSKIMKIMKIMKIIMKGLEFGSSLFNSNMDFGFVDQKGGGQSGGPKTRGKGILNWSCYF